MPEPANVRVRGDRNIETIAASLMRFGQQKPIVVDEAGRAVAGNGTLEAPRSLGWKKIAVVRASPTGSDATVCHCPPRAVRG